MMDYLKAIILVQLFFSFAITVIVYALPADLKVYVDPFSDVSGSIDMQGVANDLESNLQGQQNIPLIDVGALVFYSGNKLLDLILNFIFAVPEMIGLLIYGIVSLLGNGVDSFIMATVQLFTFVTVSALYIVSAIQMLTEFRGRGAIT